ncbi:hypothetical protein [Streptomyces sp. Amel2xC10]|uniref:hypothetical protein n=1 Tax=Streptomyces sp. Amel2xC10 TaxID=1305826 RepID=UPI000A08BDF7|nr:hypothetical protein [Streptomyces sp. Amel2xC10]SMF64273.1 hypothetical protein SAMN02745830_04986 [Streptomyces sp. Amel2xC10]
MNLRLVALGGVVACVLALPLAMASAGSKGAVGDEGRAVAGAAGADAGEAEGAADGVGAGGAAGRTDPKAPRVGPAASPDPSPSASPLLLGLGLATAARCGPELTSPDGVEAQTCVLTQGADTWARTYYRNATGRALNAVLSLMGPEGRTVQTRCAVGAEDEPDACETPRERTRGALDGYSAVTEFVGAVGEGRLLLRSGSNS